jgi:putative transcriptional regulator
VSLLDTTNLLHYDLMESLLYMGPQILNRVRELREARAWTQQQLADAVGVSRQSINSIERDRYIPSLPLALTFARIFGRPTDEIFILNSKMEHGDSTHETGEDD